MHYEFVTCNDAGRENGRTRRAPMLHQKRCNMFQQDLATCGKYPCSILRLFQFFVQHSTAIFYHKPDEQAQYERQVFFIIE